jgi:2'-5' RNA ligase
MRTFIAIDIPETNIIQSVYSDFSNNLTHTEIKYTKPGMTHLTLAFLGETSEDQINSVCRQLDVIKNQTDEFELELYGLGLFMKKSISRVLWIGILANQPLENLWNQVSASLVSSEILPDPCTYSPHITVGRIKKNHPESNLDRMVQKYGKQEFGKIKVREITYYQSFLTQQGSIYTPIQKFSLTKINLHTLSFKNSNDSPG